MGWSNSVVGRFMLYNNIYILYILYYIKLYYIVHIYILYYILNVYSSVLLQTPHAKPGIPWRTSSAAANLAAASLAASERRRSDLGPWEGSQKWG